MGSREERPLVGRDGELRTIAAALEDARAGRGRVIVLSGEPGIGKTRLADEIASIAQDGGFAVAWGRCWEADGVPPPYLPWAQILRAYRLDPQLAPAVASRANELAAIVPELGDGTRFGDDARFQVLDAVASTLATGANAKPLLVVVDDAHAADPPSLHALHFCARNVRTMRAVLLVTARDVAATPVPEAATLLHKIGREGDRIALRRLSIAEVERWIAQREPSRAASLAGDVHRVTEGNPLFVDEVLRMSAVRGIVVPEEVRTVIAAHLELLPESIRELLSIASVLGRDIDAQMLSDTSGVHRDEVERALVAAVKIGVVVERIDGQRAFAHVLLRDELYRALSPSRRAAFHWKIGETLAAGGDPDRLAPAAHHLLEGAPVGDYARMLAVIRRAAERANRVAAFEQAAALLDRARALSPDEKTRVDLAIEVASTTIRAGTVDEGKKMALDAAERARAIRDPELMARAALVYGTEMIGGRVDPVMVRLLRDALEALGPARTGLRARVLSRLGSAIVPGTDEIHREAATLAREAMSIAEELGDDMVTYPVVQWAAPALGFTIPSRERTPIIRKILELAQRLGDPLGELRARQLDLIYWIEEGRPDIGLAPLLAKVEELNRPYYAWRGPLARATVAISQGDLATADALMIEVRASAEAVGVLWLDAMFALVRVSTIVALGDPEAYAHEDSRLQNIMHGAAHRPWMLALLASLRGRRQEALEWLSKAPPLVASTPLLVPAGEVAQRLGLRDRAAEVYDLLAADEAGNPFCWGPSGAMCFGPTSLTTARLALLLDRVADAVRWFEQALRRCDQAGFPMHRAQAEAELADALDRRDEPGDRERATALRASALQRAEQLGMAAFVARLRAGASSRRSVAPVPREAPRVSLAREGDVWRLDAADTVVRLKDGKGVRYLERLLREPGRELHVLDLVGLDEEQTEVVSGDAGPLLDAKAKATYRARLDDLRDALEEATHLGDSRRADRARAEIDAIADELARAVGLGGRDRKSGSAAEKARINVQRRLRDTLDRIEEHAPDLGRWLAASIKTGTYCSFAPVPR